MKVVASIVLLKAITQLLWDQIALETLGSLTVS